MMHGNANVDWDAAKGAILSECEKYRYYLWRRVQLRVGPRANTRVVFVMLNPSTADDVEDDPTIRKCMSYVRRWGFEWLDVVNLFAFRATSPKQLYTMGDVGQVGSDNNQWISDICSDADLTICAWGQHGKLLDRQKDVLRHLPEKIHALKLNGDGSPAHPLYLKNDLKPVPWYPT